MTQKITPTLTLYDSTIARIEAEAARRGISTDDLIGELLTISAAALDGKRGPAQTGAEGAPAYYTPAEAAALLRMKATTVTEYCRSGRIAATKAGGRRWRIPAEALRAFLDRG